MAEREARFEELKKLTRAEYALERVFAIVNSDAK